MNEVPMKFDYSKTINEQLPTFNYYKDRYCSYALEIMKLQQENQELKKQLANNGIVSTCENCEWFGICPHSYREFDYKNECEKLKTQQQEFIKYLEDEIKKLEEAKKYPIEFHESNLLVKRFDIILQKYKEIIGDKDD